MYFINAINSVLVLKVNKEGRLSWSKIVMEEGMIIKKSAEMRMGN